MQSKTKLSLGADPQKVRQRTSIMPLHGFPYIVDSNNDQHERLYAQNDEDEQPPSGYNENTSIKHQRVIIHNQVLRIGGKKKTVAVRTLVKTFSKEMSNNQNHHHFNRDKVLDFPDNNRKSQRQVTISVSPPAFQRQKTLKKQETLRKQETYQNEFYNQSVSQSRDGLQIDNHKRFRRPSKLQLNSQAQITSLKKINSFEVADIRAKTIEIQQAILYNNNLSMEDKENLVGRLQHAQKTINSSKYSSISGYGSNSKNVMQNSLAKIIMDIHNQVQEKDKINLDQSQCSYMNSFDEESSCSKSNRRNLPIFGDVKQLQKDSNLLKSVRRTKIKEVTIKLSNLEEQLKDVVEILMNQFVDIQRSGLFFTEDSFDQEQAPFNNGTHLDEWKKEKKKHSKRIFRDPFENPYSIYLNNSYNFNSVWVEFKAYHDDYPLLKVRCYFSYAQSTITSNMLRIVETQAFLFLMLSLYVVNLYLFIQSNAYDGDVSQGYPIDTFQHYQILIAIYVGEAVMQIFGTGIVNFYKDKWNLYNGIITVTFGIHLYMPWIIPFDISPIRTVRLVVVLSNYIKNLHVMMDALQEATRFLMESLLIVFIFGLYFSLQGLHLFTGLFKNRCMELENGMIKELDLICGYVTCPEGSICIKMADNLIVSDNFDNIFYSFFLMLRSATRINWSSTMYDTMTSFHSWTWIYYVMIMFIVGVFGFNMIIAVLKVHYNQVVEDQENGIEEQKESTQKMSIHILRHFGLYKIFQELHKKKMIRMTSRKSVMTNVFQASELFQRKQIKQSETTIMNTNWQKDMDNINYQELNKNEKFLLSARQRRELKEQEGQFLDIDKNDSKWTMCLKSIQVRNLILPNRKFEKLNYRFMEETEQKTQIDNRLRRILRQLKNLELLAWKKEIDFHQPYHSDSHYDVIENTPEKKEKIQINLKQSNLKRYYLLQGQDLVEMNKMKLIQKATTRKNTNIPVLKRLKHKIIENKVFQLEGSQVCTPVAKVVSQKSVHALISFKKIVRHVQISNQFKIKSPAKKVNQLELNGQIYRFDELVKMIHRVISNENDQTLLSNEEEQEELELEYTDILQEEINQQGKFINIWSGNDVNLSSSTFLKKKNYFKSLNNIDKEIYLKGFKGLFRLIRKYTLKTLRMEEVNIFFDLCVCFNIVFLTFNGIIDENLVVAVNDVTTLLLFIELLMRLASTKLSKFCKSKANIVDALVVLINLGVILVSQLIQNAIIDDQIKVIVALKAILAYRVIKYYSFAVKMMNLAIASLPYYVNLTFLMFVLVFLFAFLGQELFKGKYDMLHNEVGQMHSFQDIGKAWMTVFQLSTNDGWIDSFTLGNTYSTIWASCIYFLLIIYMVNYMMLGFIIAIILEIFQKYLLEGEDEIEKQMNEIEALNAGIQGVQEEGPISPSPQYLKQPSLNFISQDEIIQDPDQKQIEKLLDVKKQIALVVHNHFKGTQLYENEECESSLFIFNKSSKFRQMCYRFIKQKQVVFISNVIVFISIINIAFYTYFDYEAYQYEDQQIFLYIEQVCNVWLLLKSIFEIISFGLCLDKGSYLQEIWRGVDFCYVCAFFVHETLMIDNIIVFILLTLRYLRPIKMIFMFQGLNEIKDAIAQSLHDILNVLVILLSVWMIFAIFGITLYKDKLWYCDDKMEFYVNKQECLDSGRQWINYVHNFDDITQAMPTLFVLATLDEWGEHLQICANSYKPDYGPRPFANQWPTYIFFFLFIFVGSMFLLGFFMGVLFINFQVNRIKLMNPDLTQDQMLFLSISKTILQEQPYYSNPPKSKLRVFALKVLQLPTYHNIVVFAIIVNTIVLAMFYEDGSENYKIILNYIHQVNSWILIFDTLLKIFTYGWVRYINQYWRQIEMFISVVSLIDFVIDIKYDWFRYYISSGFNDPYFRYARLFFILRDIRILLIIQEFQGLTRLLSVLGFALTLLFKILFVFLIVIFVYVFYGCYLFGGIDKGHIVNSHINFQNFHLAALTLFKCASGDHWRFIMVDFTDDNPYCENNNKYCGSPWAYVYFISFMLLSNFVMLNLFILALVDQFESFFNSQNNVVQTYIEYIDRFRTVWCKYTFDSRGKKMHTRFLANFLLELGEPLGCQNGDNIWDAAKNASNFHIRQDMNGYVHFKEVLYETIKFANKEKTFKVGSEEGLKLMKEHDKNMRFSLHYRRMTQSITNRRFPIQNRMELRGNFNILQEYFYLLQVFKTWQSYSNRIFKIVDEQQHEYSENSLNSLESSQNSEEGIDQNRITIIHPTPQVQKIPEDFFKDDDYQMKRRCSTTEDDDIALMLSSLPHYEITNDQDMSSSLKVSDSKPHVFIFHPVKLVKKKLFHYPVKITLDSDIQRLRQTSPLRTIIIGNSNSNQRSSDFDLESYRSILFDANLQATNLISQREQTFFKQKPQFCVDQNL